MKELINKIFNEDCIKTMKRMKDNSIDLIVTDPPYSSQTHLNAMTMDKKGNPVNANIEKSFSSINETELNKIFEEIARISKKWVITFADWKHIAELERNTPKGLKFIRAGVWVKPSYMPQITGDRPAQSWEMFCYMHKDVKGKMIWNGGGTGSHYVENKDKVSTHPTEKPIKIIEDLIEKFSNENDLVYDPFSGSGTTLIACKNKNRNFIGSELSSEYVDIIKERINKSDGNVGLFEQMKLF